MTGLTWTLGIATYNRADVLRRCLLLAAKQTRPPVEIVVVDGSDDWAETREKALAELAEAAPGLRVIYDEAVKRSAAAQRNQCLRAASGDVVFLFDDDSLMYPDCAERIMAIYDADRTGRIAGVAAVLANDPPDETGGDAEGDGVNRIAASGFGQVDAKRSGASRFARNLLGASRTFVPYDPAYVLPQLPEDLGVPNVGLRDTMAGFTMTVRREVGLAEPFEEILMDRGPEDSDASHRYTRHGALATALDARVCHLVSPAGRFGLYSRFHLGMLGAAVAHRLHCVDPAWSRPRFRKMIFRRLLIAAIKDVRRGNPQMSEAKAAWDAWRLIDRVFRMPEEELRRWYPEYQRGVLGRK
ncbi:MAG: hypothetical protein CMJ31_08230 [Phycisphaerae bacterium]|nr:hypothetical protein [Phycisphaerae bacterium]